MWPWLGQTRVNLRAHANIAARSPCGHDERHWFVAAVPETAAVSTVATAMEALKPVDVRRLQRQVAVKPRKLNRRRNEVFVRQGNDLHCNFRIPMTTAALGASGAGLPPADGAGQPHRT